MIELRSCLILLVVHAVTGCDRNQFIDRLQHVCEVANPLNIFYWGQPTQCGSVIRGLQHEGFSQLMIQYPALPDMKYTVLVLAQDEYPRGGVSLLPRVEMAAIGIQGSIINGGYTIPASLADCTSKCCSANGLDMKYMFILLEETTSSPYYVSKPLIDLWDFMTIFNMCDPIAMSELYVPAN